MVSDEESRTLMVFPDKLPLAAIAVGFAAAVQAATTTTFFPACAWGLVILATAFEFAWWSSTDWNRWPKWGIRILPIVLLAPLASLFAYRAYHKEFLENILRVNFNIPHPSQIGTDKLDLNYLVVNKGLEPILIEQINGIEIATTDFSNNPSRNNGLCKVRGLYLPSDIMKDWPHPGSKGFHSSMERPPREPAAYGSQGPPPFLDDGKLDTAIYYPKTLVDDSSGKDVSLGAISIDPGKAVSFSASFDTDPATWGTHNVMILCGAIKYVGNDGVEAWAVCPAWTVAQVYHDGKSAGEIVGPGSPKGFEIITTGPNERACGVL